MSTVGWSIREKSARLGYRFLEADVRLRTCSNGLTDRIVNISCAEWPGKLGVRLFAFKMCFASECFQTEASIHRFRKGCLW